MSPSIEYPNSVAGESGFGEVGADDDAVGVDDGERSVVHLLAVEVRRPELARLGKEVPMLLRHRNPRRVSSGQQVLGARRIRHQALADDDLNDRCFIEAGGVKRLDDLLAVGMPIPRRRSGESMDAGALADVDGGGSEAAADSGSEGVAAEPPQAAEEHDDRRQGPVESAIGASWPPRGEHALRRVLHLRRIDPPTFVHSGWIGRR